MAVWLGRMMASDRRLLVVTSQFPEPNETFIVREMGELTRRGFALTILSLRPPPPVIYDPEARALLPLVVYPPPRMRSIFAERSARCGGRPAGACGPSLAA